MPRHCDTVESLEEQAYNLQAITLHPGLFWLPSPKLGIVTTWNRSVCLCALNLLTPETQCLLSNSTTQGDCSRGELKVNHPVQPIMSLDKHTHHCPSAKSLQSVVSPIAKLAMQHVLNSIMHANTHSMYDLCTSEPVCWVKDIALKH